MKPTQKAASKKNPIPSTVPAKTPSDKKSGSKKPSPLPKKK